MDLSTTLILAGPYSAFTHRMTWFDLTYQFIKWRHTPTEAKWKESQTQIMPNACDDLWLGESNSATINLSLWKVGQRRYQSAPRDDDDDGRWANFCATKNRLQPSLHIAGHFFHLLAQFGRKLLLHLQHPIECPQVQMECFCADRAVLILLLHSKNAIVAVSLYIRLCGD